MSIDEGRIAYFPNHSAASRAEFDFWLAKYREDTAGVPLDGGREHAIAVLTFADDVLRTNTRERLAGMVTAAVERIAELEQQRQYAVRYLTAYRSARQRADAVHQALVEADEERDYLRAQLAERDLEVARLTVQLARRSGAMP